MDLIALSAEITIANGVAETSAGVPGLLAQPAPSKAARGRERDYLFAHLALTGAPEETEPLAVELIEQFGAQFYRTTGSVTAALRRAVLDLNERLLYTNLQSKRSHEGAISCAVLHGDELFTLQVGEALAFLGHNFGVERLPAKRPEIITPLGRSAGIDIRFAYNRLQIGDMMLLADPRQAYLNGTTLEPVLVDSEIESGIEELVNLTGQDAARMLLVEFTDEVPATLPINLMPAARASATRPRPPAPVKASTSATPVTTMEGPVREAGQPAMRPVGGPALSTTAMETKAKQAAAQSARGLSQATGWLALLVSRLRPPVEETSEEESVGWAVPTLLAILIPLVVVVIVASVFLQRGNVQELGEIKQAMIQQTLLAEDVLASDPVQAKAHYDAVVALAAEAETIRPGDLEVSRMRNEARNFLDQLDGVARLRGRPLVSYADDAVLAGIELSNEETSGFFVANESSGSILFQPTDSSYGSTEGAEARPIAFRGQSVGTQIVGPLVDMMWRDTGTAETRQGLAMLDSAGLLFTYYPNLGDMRGVPLDQNGEWLNPAAMTEFASRMYVLDTGSGTIWKYYPEGEGFSQREGDATIFFSEQVDLGQAVDFDIYSEDGSLIVIYNDGRVRYYDTLSGRIKWDENTLLENGLNAPFVSPAAVRIVGRGATASIYILDPGSGRLVQVSRAGIVVTQFRVLDEQDSDLLRQSRDFAVAETPLRVFVVVGNQVYLATLN